MNMNAQQNIRTTEKDRNNNQATTGINKPQENDENATAIDINELSYEELCELQDRLNQRLQTTKYSTVIKAFDVFAEACDGAGIKIIDAINISYPGLIQSNGKKKRPAYINPDNHKQTWNGASRKPNWITDKEAMDTLDECKVYKPQLEQLIDEEQAK